MPKNRLRLDFSLQTAEERLNFLNSYLPTITFEPDEHEQETLSDYILWGKNKNGLNTQQEGSVILKEWTTSKVDSIDGLMEMPGFQESKLQKLGDTHYKIPRVIFNREEALKKSPPHLKAIFEELFAQIDYIELVINYYDLQSGKRKTPPRDSLLVKFSEEKRQKCMQKAASLTQRQYLKMRHRLVELRTEQYTYRDCISSTILPHSEVQTISTEETFRFDEDIKVLPLGLNDNSPWAKKIFNISPDPFSFTEADLKKVSNLIWNSKNSKMTLNFEDPTHLLALYRSYKELKFEAEQDPNQIYSSTAAVFRTLQFYENSARLNDLQREILHLKINQVQNLSIAQYINKKYGTTYNDNYISTIFRRKILPTIAEAATYHKMVIDNIFYPENFKRCKDCGQLFLRAPEFFMRQHKAPDGFSPRCKRCQKIKREQEKNKYEIRYVANRIDQ